MIDPRGPIRLTCPACGKFLVTLEGTMAECPPCRGCGIQTTVKVPAKRGVGIPAGIMRDMETK